MLHDFIRMQPLWFPGFSKAGIVESKNTWLEWHVLLTPIGPEYHMYLGPFWLVISKRSNGKSTRLKCHVLFKPIVSCPLQTCRIWKHDVSYFHSTIFFVILGSTIILYWLCFRRPVWVWISSMEITPRLSILASIFQCMQFLPWFFSIQFLWSVASKQQSYGCKTNME